MSTKSKECRDLTDFLVGVSTFSFRRRLPQQQQKKIKPTNKPAIAIEATEMPTAWPVVNPLGDCVEVVVGDVDTVDEEAGVVAVESVLLTIVVGIA